MVQIIEYLNFCKEKGLKPNRQSTLEKFLSQIKKA